jgi:hypothetical protein
MPTTEANPPLTTTAHCPLCDAPLNPEHPDACSKCDWVAPHPAAHHGGGSLRDKIAVGLSVVPGLGHIYKGHRLTGALYMLGALFASIAAGVAGTFTAGFGICLLPLYWIGVMLQVYWLEDRGVKSNAVAVRRS